jgi:hypothetical protein
MINKKDKKANVKPFMAKNYLWVFVNCLIENPAFDSQVGTPCRLRQAEGHSRALLRCGLSHNAEAPGLVAHLPGGSRPDFCGHAMPAMPADQGHPHASCLQLWVQV